MSDICSEQGSISFTKTGFARISKLIIEGYNERQNTLYNFASNVYLALNSLPDAKQHDAFKSLQYKNNGSFSLSSYGGWIYDTSHQSPLFLGKVQYPEQSLSYSEAYDLEDELFRGKNGRLCKPRKSSFKTVSFRGKNEIQLSDGDLTVTLDKEECELEWNVSENNHAIRDAEESVLGSITLSSLNSHKWSKHEGGVFDSYSEFNDPPMSGSDYPSRRFGPLGEEYMSKLSQCM